MMLQDYLLRSSELYADKTALVCGSSKLTYAQLAAQSMSLASFLASNGLNKGDRVLIHLGNSPEAIVSIFGTLMAGGMFVVVNPATPAERFKYLVDHCSPKFVVDSGQRVPDLAAGNERMDAQPRRLRVGTDPEDPGGLNFADAMRTSGRIPSVEVTEADLAAIIYTSGSTGEPRGVTLSHKNIDTVTESVAGYLKNSPEDVILCVLQLSSGYGLLQLLTTFRTGGRLVLERGFMYPHDFVSRISNEGITGFAGVPTLFASLLQLSVLDPSIRSSLRYMTNAAAAMPQPFIPKLRKLFPGTKLYLMHGLTECLRTTFLPPDEIERRPTSVGRGMNNVELWIEDQHGNRLSAGETGEMVVRGANVMQGYWNNPEETQRVLRPGKSPGGLALHTGDLFTMDADGYFYFVARTDDVIKCRGEKVSPVEVENLIYSLAEVSECRVFGVPDEIDGQAVRAEIVVRDGSLLKEKQVKAHCAKHLESYKIPKTVEFVPSIPKTLGGKIIRRPRGPNAPSRTGM